MPSTLTAMPRHALLLAALALLTGCSAGGGGGQRGDAGSPAAPEVAGEAPVAVSPGGVTTKIEVPAQSTEEQYAQACMAAKDWMDARGGDPQALVEPYLQQIQASTSSGPQTFRTTWAELSEPQRAAVIIAVRAAADGGC